MLDSIFKFCETEWVKTKTKKNHPFRYFSLATVDPNGKAESRMVVLRKFDESAVEFTVYTDARTPKIKSLTLMPDAELLFYDHKKLCQIRVKANCIQQKDQSYFYNSIKLLKKITLLLSPWKGH